MEARVKADFHYPSWSNRFGHVYVKGEWRTVPAGFEGEAVNHPELETREGPEAEKPEAEKPAVKKPAAKPKGKAKP